MPYPLRTIASAALVFALCAGTSCKREPTASIESFIREGDAARKKGHMDKALTVYQNGLALADKDKEPQQWINLAALVANMHLFYREYADAKKIHDDIRRLQERYQGELPPRTRDILAKLRALP